MVNCLFWTWLTKYPDVIELRTLTFWTKAFLFDWPKQAKYMKIVAACSLAIGLGLSAETTFNLFLNSMNGNTLLARGASIIYRYINRLFLLPFEFLQLYNIVIKLIFELSSCFSLRKISVINSFTQQT